MSKLLPILALALLVATFLPGLSGPFLLDDEMNLARARAPSGTIDEYVDAVVRNGTGLLRRPVSNASFLANYHLFGYSPFPYKLVNLVIHAVNGLLVWLLASTVLRALQATAPRGTAFVVAVLWTLHPLQVSTVLYVVQRMTQLSALFTIAFVAYALYAVNRWRNLPLASGPSPYSSAAIGLALIGLAVLSKENGALAPLLLASILVCTPSGTLRPKNAATAKFLALVVALPLLAGTLVAPFALPGVLAGYHVRDFSMLERLLTQPLVLSHYLSTILWPDIRNMGLYLDIFEIQRASDPIAWLGLAISCTIVAGAVLIRRRAPVLAFSVLWFASAHAMESTILPLEMAFEHRNHVAMIGPILALTYYAASALRGVFVGRQMALLAAIPILLLAGLTAHRSHTWSSDDLFTINEVQNHPKSPRATTQAAAREVARGNVAGAVDLVRRAQQLQPNSFWMRAYDIHLACAGAPVTIDWEALLRQARQRPDEMGIEEALRPPVRLVELNQCPSLDIAQFDFFLRQLLVVMERHARKSIIERLFILRAQLAAARGDMAAEESLLEQAWRANPEGLDALMRLAYRSLNIGNVADADRHAIELERRIGAFHRATLHYKVNELRGFIEQERAEQQSQRAK